MQRYFSGKFLNWLLSLALLGVLVGGEIWLQNSISLRSANREDGIAVAPSNLKEEPCTHTGTSPSYTRFLQDSLCSAVAKNFIFIDAHHDTINAISTLFVALFTFTLWTSTRGLWRASLSQSRDMRDSIAEASRAAAAMEAVSEHLKVNADKIVESVDLNKVAMERQRRFSELQQRAYVCALIGGGVYQDREKKLRFEAKPVLRNFGFTPAYGVTWQIRAAILPNPIPKDFNFTLPKAIASDGLLLPPHLPMELSALVQDYVEDSEVENIKRRAGKALHVWGVVAYYDVSHRRRRTTFHHQLHFYRNNEGNEFVGGSYMPTHNKGT